MRFRIGLRLLPALCGLALLPVAPLLGRGQTLSPAAVRRHADRHFDEKSYATALGEYRKTLPTLPAQASDRTRVEYRIAVALARTQQWSEATAALDVFLRRHGSDPLWRARAESQAGLLLELEPHQGYKVGGKVYRGRDYPHTRLAEKPEFVSLQQDDLKAATAALERSVTAYERLAPARRRTVAAEESDVCFDLAKTITRAETWGSDPDWKTVRATDWAIDPSRPYSPHWPAPKKVLFLLTRVPRLHPADTHTTVLAQMARALYVAQSRQNWERRASVRPGVWRVVQALPYAKIDASAILTQTATAYPADPQAPQLRLMAAQWAEQAGQFGQALAEYRALVARYPGNPWTPDARARIEGIQRPTLDVSTPGPLRPGAPATLRVGSRNLSTLTFRAYRVSLAQILTQPNKLTSPRNQFTQFSGNFGPIRDAAHLGPQVAAWTDRTRDRGDHKPLSETIRAPLSQRGAYLVVAAGAGGQVRAATIVLLSDLTLVKKTDNAGVLCFVADSRSGRPVPGAKVVVRETYRQNDRPHVLVSQGQTDAGGVYTAPRIHKTGAESEQIEALASAPGARYALTNPDEGGWYGDDGDTGRDEVKVYAYTDRPVYRPGQTVHFRDLLAKRRGGSDFVPLVGVPATVTVRDSHDQQIYTTTVTSSAFGSVSGSFPLAAGTPLGEYSVSVAISNKSGDLTDSGSSRFRVEEYKKPEYLVKVTPSTLQARFGDKVTATISAAYYYGGPVAGAAVTYKVFRSPFTSGYRFPQPYDWLYRNWGGGDDPNLYAETGELVTQGHGVLDGQGRLSVSFAANRGTRGYQGDYSYTVKAEVVDASRRQIAGEGVLKVSRRQFYAYLNIPNSFYQQGDIAQIELRTQDANAQPVAAAGTLTVYALTYATGGKEIATPVHTATVATDADGKGFTTWRADQSGRYRVTWTATDRFAQRVFAKAPLWIAGAGLAARRFHIGGVTLLSDKTTYQEGDTAHLLVIADQADDWVLLTQETGDQILTHQLYHVPGRARTLDVPIVRAHVPNFALAAVSVRDYQCFRWQQEVFVPPARQFTRISVTGDKAEYRPGDTGTFHIQTADFQGRPVRSEVSLAVVDSSVYSIQPEYAPDIRLFYYGDRRDINVQVDSSLDTYPIGQTESDRRLPDYKRHGIVLPDFGRLPGPFVSPYYGGGFRDVNGSVLYSSEDGSVGAVAHAVAPAAPMAMSGAPPPKVMNMNGDTLLSIREPASSYSARGALQAQRPAFQRAQVRSFFPDTAFWTPAVVTDAATGAATLAVKFPDTLTTWKAVARGLTTGVQVGAADTEVVTNKHLLVRLEAPRFFVERDRVTLSAIVRNDLQTAKTVRVSLQTDPDVLAARETALSVTIPAGSDKRVDWPAQVVGSGPTSVTMTAETDEESDAVRQTFPALPYGAQKFEAQSGVLPGGAGAAHLTLTLPAAHRAGTAALLVQIAPSLAATTLDALPYLADYPYGCVEQTMSRFLPSVLVAKTLRDAGVNLDTLQKRAQLLAAREQAGTPFGQAQDTTNDTDQTGYTYPHGTPGVMKTPELAEELGHTDRWNNPVFDPQKLHAMVGEGLARLASMQRSDGGWGWWPDSPVSDPYMSAYVVYGLATAKAAGLAVPPALLRRGGAYLAADIKTRDDQRDLAVWEAFALSSRGALPASASRVVSVAYAQRDRLSPYGQALLALTLHNTGRSAEAQIVCRNMQNTATLDRENGTATWKPRDDCWWRWDQDTVETVAWALQAYVAVLPKSEITPMLVKWLVQNKRGSAWRSTKETAMAVYALTDYLRAGSELAPEETVTVALGNKVSRSFQITPENALLFDNRFLVPDTLLMSGPQTVTITKRGPGRLYYTSALQYVTTEENIHSAGTELKVGRRYFRLTPKTKVAKDAEGGTFHTLDYTRTQLSDGAALRSGDLLEVDLVLDSKNEYDYCCIEDMKPAGCEPLDLRSGGQAGDTLWSNEELRDTKTVFFVDHLPQGTQILRYRLRAETPGEFHALPTNAYALYAPEVRALSDGWHTGIADAP